MRSLLSMLLLLSGLASLTTSAQSAEREDVRLTAGWRFYPGDLAGGEPASTGDSAWQTVTVPHCWGWDEAQRGQAYRRGPSWYQRELDIAPQSGKRYFLRFEAASLVAQVFLNGQLLGEHRGGFGAFSFEITTNLSPAGTNRLAVRVSNAPEPDVAPLSGDFSIYGGLYRPVHLITTGEENFTLTDHGSPGVAWLQSSVTTTQAVLDVTPQISNGTRRRQALTLVARVLDAQGHEITRVEQAVTLQPAVTAPFPLRLVLNGPHLWNGRLDPYLYRAVVELRTPAGVEDAVEQPLGLRFYAIDPDRGFFLNGRPYPLHGVNRHQDRPIEGWAITEADLSEDVALLQEIGATVVRCAHYQHSDYFYSLCDRAGILVWAEIPQVDRIGGEGQFESTSEGQLRDLIRQNLNHPAIFAWSLFNELRPGTPDPHRELQDLNLIAHGEDPTRPTIAATCVNTLPQMNRIPDLLGWNIYPGWYSEWGALTNFSAMEQYRSTSRHGGFCISEYGAGANVTQHEDNPRQPATTGQWHPEEWQALVHEAAWRQFKSHPYIWATFVWNMFDFAVSTRHEGGVEGRNDKGLVTYDRKIKKDAFFFYKANWSDAPVLYLTSRRFTQRTSAVTSIKVYSNASQVEVSLNGTSLGARNNDGNCVFIWQNVTLAPGKNTVTARAERNGQILTDDCEWHLLSP